MNVGLSTSGGCIPDGRTTLSGSRQHTQCHPRAQVLDSFLSRPTVSPRQDFTRSMTQKHSTWAKNQTMITLHSTHKPAVHGDTCTHGYQRTPAHMAGAMHDEGSPFASPVGQASHCRQPPRGHTQAAAYMAAATTGHSSSQPPAEPLPPPHTATLSTFQHCHCCSACQGTVYTSRPGMLNQRRCVHVCVTHGGSEAATRAPHRPLQMASPTPRLHTHPARGATDPSAPRWHIIQ